MIYLTWISISIVYSFVGMTAGMLAYNKTRNSDFWDESIAAFLAGGFWIVSIPAILIFKSAQSTVSVLEDISHDRQLREADKQTRRALNEAQKGLPKATIKKG